MELTEQIQRAWGWTGITPTEVVGENAFGNLIVRDDCSLYWRICPEDLYCQVVAHSRVELDQLSRDQEFLHDWNMQELVEQAEGLLGQLPLGRKYCLKIPGVLGGEYGGTNLATMELGELVLVSGRIAEQIADLPEGATVQLKIAD